MSTDDRSALASRAVAMKRRSLLRSAAASVAFLATTCAAPPPVATRKLRLGAFTSEDLPADGSRPLVEQDIMEGLRAEGFVAGTNMTIEWRHAQGDVARLPEFATELVRLPVDILIASTTSAAVAAKAATNTIPIVMQGAGDAIDSNYDLIDSYAHPGGNVTGTAFENRAEAGKRLETIREAVPGLSRVVVLGVGSTGIATQIAAMKAELRRAADALGIELLLPETHSDVDVTRALESAGSGDGLLSIGSVLMFHNTARMVAFAAARRLPAAYTREADVRAGGLLSYGSNRRESRIPVGKYVRRIVEGASPADLPVLLPQTFDLAVNLVTARGLGLTLPASVLARATTVVR